MRKTFIFGHRNPDTDATCSAIALSYLENKLGNHTEPRVLGALNKEAQYALKTFNIEEPEFLDNVKVRIRDVNYAKGVMMSEKSSIKEVIDSMNKNKCSGMPIVDEKNKLNAFISLKEIAKVFVENSKDHLSTNYNLLLETLDGKEILHYDDEFDGKILAGSYQSQTFFDRANINKNDILIIGDRHKILEHCINSKISLIVITNGIELESDLLELAKKNKVNVISSPHDTYNTCSKIALSNYVRTIALNKNPKVFQDTNFLTDFVQEANKLGHTNYPVVNKNDKCEGLIRLTDAGSYTKQDVILVDHNNFEQSVTGLDEANIVEIIDHHNLGGIGTNVPINFRGMPVGCTSTILYFLYKEKEVEIPQNIAGIMLSAILSDTLILKSPTTTDMDRRAVEELSKIAKVNYEEYGLDLLKAGSSIEGMSIDDIIYNDFKTFKVSNNTFGIGQVITMDIDKINNMKDEFVTRLNELGKTNFKTIAVFVTDIVKNGSYILFDEKSKEILMDAYDLEELEEGTFIKDMVSRKKQMLPGLMEAFEKTN